MPLTPETWLDEQTVNITTAGSQTAPKIIQLANGNILVCWVTSDAGGLGSPTGNEIFAQIFDPAGNKVGVEFRLNNVSTLDDEQFPDIAALPNGGFVVVYHDVDNPFNSGASNIRLEEYDASGTAQTSNASVVLDSGTPADPNYSNPIVAVSSGTSVLITYVETSGGVSNVRGKIYDPTTDTYSAEISILAFSGGNTTPVVTTLSNGNYVIAARNGSSDSFIGYRILSPTGANVLGATVVTGTDTNTFNDREPSVTALAGGGFVIVWTNTDGNDTDILGRVYNSAGTQVGSFSPGDTGATNNNNEARVIALADGGFVVAWDNDEVTGVNVQRYNSTGSVVGSTFVVSADNANSISGIGLADGRFALVWDEAGAEISMEILDTRDAVNATPVNTTNLQVGTNDADTFTVNGSTGAAYGGAGDDVITADGSVNVFGGEGNDTIFAGLGTAELLDGGVGIDTLNTTLFGGYYEVNLTTGVTNFSPESYINFENIVVGNGGSLIVGTTGNNNITGGTGADVIYGSTIGDVSAFGFDTINSGDGNDTVHSSGDGVFNLGAGNDTFFAGLTGTTETADGGIGVDTLDTTSFNGTYTVNLTSGLTNFGGESYINFENVTSGNGNDTLLGTNGDNVMSGGAGNDVIAGLGGNDTLSGGTGTNELIGGTGNDIYIVTANNTVEAVQYAVVDLVGEGIDEIRATAPVFSLEWYGTGQIELLTMTDNGNHGAVIGNALDNVITGGTGTDEIFGRAGNDTLIGGTGNTNALFGQEGDDIYVVQVAGDSVFEAAGQGSDRVEAAIANYVLGANVENLFFTGANSDRIGVGNSLGNAIRGLGGADSLDGAGGDDVIIGGSGADLLQGGSGADQFRYEGGETGLDRIIDFVSGADDIALRSAFFTPTATVAFVTGTAATTTNSTIIYDPTTGIVYYDDDGTGAGAAVALAQLNAGQTFTAGDFLFY